MKPIDGEQLEEIIYKFYCKNCREKRLDRCRGCKVTNILGFMKKLCGKVEAKPVVHAHWEKVREGLHVCSRCKVKAPIESDEYDYMESLSTYCPLCGAQMDEKEK